MATVEYTIIIIGEHITAIGPNVNTARARLLFKIVPTAHCNIYATTVAC